MNGTGRSWQVPGCGALSSAEDKKPLQTTESLTGAWEMPQRPRARAAHPEDLGSFPSPTWQLVTVCNSTSRRSNSFLWPSCTCTGMYAHTHKYLEDNKSYKTKVIRGGDILGQQRQEDLKFEVSLVLIPRPKDLCFYFIFLFSKQSFST